MTKEMTKEMTTNADWIEFWKKAEGTVDVTLVGESNRYFNVDDVKLEGGPNYILRYHDENDQQQRLIIHANNIHTPIDPKPHLALMFYLSYIPLDNLSKFPLCFQIAVNPDNMSEDNKQRNFQEMLTHFMGRAINASLNLIFGVQRHLKIEYNIYYFRIHDRDIGVIREILKSHKKVSLSITVNSDSMNDDMKNILLGNADRFRDITLNGYYFLIKNRDKFYSEFRERQRKIEIRMALRTPPLSFSQPTLPKELIEKLEKLVLSE